MSDVTPLPPGGEDADIIEPPEIREPAERYRIVEFYVSLEEPRPDIRIMELVVAWLKQRGPVPIANLQLGYHQPSKFDEPGLLAGVLLVGEPIDVG